MHAPRQIISYYEYLRIEAENPQTKHEYLGGEVLAMAGGTREHALISANVIAALTEALRDRPCAVASSDLRVRVLETGLATYPDASVYCGRFEADPEDASGNTAANPIVIVEVLSPSTEAYDRGGKLEHYKQIPSLQHILLIAQDTKRIELWSREGEVWGLAVAQHEGSVTLEHLDCTLSVADVYRNPLQG